MSGTSDAVIFSPPWSKAQGCHFIERCVSKLGSVSANLNLIVAQAELDSAPLHGLGFRSVATAAEFQSVSHNVDAELIVVLGMDGTFAHRILRGLVGLDKTPTIVIVMVVPFEDEGSQARTLSQMAPIRKSLFDAGADEVMCLFGDEVLTPARVLGSIQKSQYVANQLSEIVHDEVSRVEEKAVCKLHQAHRQFLLLLPGRALDNIPYENEDLDERCAPDGSLVGVEDWKFTSRLSAGSSGRVVVRAQHATRGTAAMEIFPKKAVKNASDLLSLDRELFHALHSAPHPHIMRALEVMHGAHNIYIVSEYGGSCHLQRFVKQAIERGSKRTLPAEKIKAFSAQQASAVSHLHAALVCHRNIKPENWIVSDDGSSVRLADLGLAAQLSGPAHRLWQRCGSLPFCAPEVFDGEGYDGLAADVWSLGLNFAELACGPYIVERLLGWLPERPRDHGAVVAGLRSLAERFASVAHLDQERPRDHGAVVAGLRSLAERFASVAHLDQVSLGRAVSNMVVLDPARRWKMAQVTAAVQYAAGGSPPSPPRQPARAAGRHHLRSVFVASRGSNAADA